LDLQFSAPIVWQATYSRTGLDFLWRRNHLAGQGEETHDDTLYYYDIWVMTGLTGFMASRIVWTDKSGHGFLEPTRKSLYASVLDSLFVYRFLFSLGSPEASLSGDRKVWEYINSTIICASCELDTNIVNGHSLAPFIWLA